MSEERLMRIEDHIINANSQLATMTSQQSSMNEKLEALVSAHKKQKERIDALYSIKNKIVGGVLVVTALFSTLIDWLGDFITEHLTK